MTRCSLCKFEKEDSEFGRSKTSKSGLKSWCKKCVSNDNAQWYAKNKAYKNKQSLEWSRANPDKMRSYRHTRRKYEVDAGTFEEEDWTRLLIQYGSRCLRCKTYDNLSLDHIVPLVKGGKNEYRNYQILCRSCNSWKGSNIIDFRGLDSSISGLLD